ncbi:NVEALA domain-containing protein [Bacteroides eggerthii]|uniref:NVEALA domain-containing protein n=1 Tax=Bacteroides eggerthii TaxID=28111 RepID=UPI0032192938
MSDFVSQLIFNYPLLPLHLTHHLENEFINVKNITSMKNMKKKVLLISLFLVVTVVASFQFSSEKENLQSLMLENIDALASDEWGGTPRCVGSGSVDCPIVNVKVYAVIGSYSLEESY